VANNENWERAARESEIEREATRRIIALVWSVTCVHVHVVMCLCARESERMTGTHHG